MLKPETAFAAGGKLSFDQSFLRFMWRVSLKGHSEFDLKYWILDTVKLSHSINCYNNLTPFHAHSGHFQLEG